MAQHDRDVRFVPKADIDACPADVRFTPKSGHVQHTGNVRFVPEADKVRCIKIRLFDHLVGGHLHE